MNKGNLVLAVAVLAAGSYYVFHDLRGKPKREEAEIQSKRFFPGLKKDQLASFEVKQLKDSGKAKPFDRFIVKKHGIWVQQGSQESHVLNGMMLSGSLRSLVDLQRSDDLGASATPPPVLNPADFGLDKPTYTITLKSTNGKAYVVNLGRRTPDSRGFYAQSPGGQIAAVSTTLADLLDPADEKLRDNSPVPYQPSKVIKLTLSLSDGKKISAELDKPREKSADDELADESVEITDLNEAWKLTQPETAPADGQKIRDFIFAWKSAKFGRFLKPSEKIDFSKPVLRFEATLEGESEPQVFELGPSVPVQPNLRYLRRLEPAGTMVIEMNNPKLMDITDTTLRQTHLAVFEPESIKRVNLKFKELAIVGSRKDKAWTLTEPAVANPSDSSRNAALEALLFEIKNLEWKSKSSETKFTEVASLQLWQAEDKAIAKVSLGQESGKGRLARMDGDPQVYLVEPDPLTKLESVARRIKQAPPTPTPGASGAPNMTTSGATTSEGNQTHTSPATIIQNGRPVIPLSSSTPTTIVIPADPPSPSKSK